MIKAGTKIRVKANPPNTDGWNDRGEMEHTKGKYGILQNDLFPPYTDINPLNDGMRWNAPVSLSFGGVESWVYFYDQVDLTFGPGKPPPKIPSIVIAKGEIKNE